MKDSIIFLDVPFSIALLSDFHNIKSEHIINSLCVHKPEMIAITGDIFYKCNSISKETMCKKQKNVIPFLKECSLIAKTFLSLGNHEWAISDEDISTIESNDVTLLDNSWVNWNNAWIGGFTSDKVTEYRLFRKIAKCGMSSVVSKKDMYSTLRKSGIPNQIDTKWLNKSLDGFKIVLCHHPEYYKYIPDDVNVVLSGHAHGGQIRLFGKGIYAPGQGFFPKYTMGVYDNRLVVSRGLSNTSIIPRLFNPKEIVYIYPDR